MAAKTPHHSAWTLDGTVGTMRRGPLSARVDLARPHLGVQHVQRNERTLAGHLLAVRRHEEATSQESNSWPLPLADAYVRGDDLVASYQPTDDWPYSPQLYWSAHLTDGVAGLLGALSLLVSVETHLLDTWPRITVASQLACHELLQVMSGGDTVEPLLPNQTVRRGANSCCVLHRLTATPISYVESMPATDFRECLISEHAGGKLRAEWHLFADFLEKGVIRKARLQCAFLSTKSDVQDALQCCAAMEQRPLPLTT